MLRKGFTDSIGELEQMVLQMGQMVITAVDRSIEALKNRDTAAAQQIIDDDEQINKLRWQIEEDCINLIATQQPVASDLREIIAVLAISTELERMGDYAEGIAKITLMHGSEPLLKPLAGIPVMAKKAADMLQKALEAFIARDAAKATAICDEDDQVDGLYDQIYRELLTYMIEDPRNITKATYLIWAAHNVERIADRVTNICERIVFLATGKMPQVNVSKY
ncbi:MAG: phosphate signaling complex protein PhoU [Sedimentisphaerales bacterium]|jgi:phosphate transport system protein|nr:phosphate signaling complex protein PhoU [Sedimentisphaerales bacterium]